MPNSPRESKVQSRLIRVMDWSAALYSLTIVASVACLALAIGRAAIARPRFANYLFGFLTAPYVLVVLLLFPAYTHRENYIALPNALTAYLALAVAMSLPKDWHSRAIKVVAFAAAVSLGTAQLYVDNRWQTAGFARRINAISSFELRSYAEAISESDVGEIASSIWADEHPNPDISELAKHRPPTPHYSMVSQWHTWFTGLYLYKETPQRIRITKMPSNAIKLELVKLH